MSKRIASLVMVVSLMLPYGRLWAAESESAETPKEEMTEPHSKQVAEEQKAMDKYNKAVEKHGKDSAEAKKAWKHVAQEYKEHGDSLPTQKNPETASPTPAKS